MDARRLSVLLVGLPLLFTAACGGDNLTLPSEGEPATITVEDGNGQQARVGSQLAESLQVRVADTRARPVAGATVQFAFDNPSGESASPEQVITDAEGNAKVSITLGTRVGAVTGHANVVVPEGTVPVTTAFSAIALSDDANGIAAVSGSGQSGPVGTTLLEPLVVQVTDRFGNPIPQIEVQWSIPDGGGSLSETSTLTDQQGMASVSRTLGTTAGEWTTQAGAGTLAGSPVIFTHTATAGNASRVEIVSGNNQNGAPNTELQNDLVVRVLDADGNPIVNRAVSWVVGTGGGTVNPETSFTDGQGQARTRWRLGPSAGTNTLSAVVSGVGRASFTATAASNASHTTITSDQPDPSVVGQTVHVEFTVTGEGGTPTGNVTVTVNGGSESCTGTVAAGACDIVLNNPGNRELTATYAGDSRFSGSLDHNSHRVEQAQPQNSPPTAAFDPPSCIAGSPCQFNDGSSDSDGNVVAWTWDFGDLQPTSDQKDPQHTYASPGTYDVKLTVRDDDGATNEVTHQVTVNAAPNFAPVATDDEYSTTTDAGFHAPGDGRLSLLANDADLDSGDVLSTTAADFTTQLGGHVTIGTDGSFDYTPPAGLSGVTDSFDYTVNDNRGGSDIGTARITINP